MPIVGGIFTQTPSSLYKILKGQDIDITQANSTASSIIDTSLFIVDDPKTCVFDDYNGTVSGTVRATASSHGLYTGLRVQVVSTPAGSWTGEKQITKIDSNTFYFTGSFGGGDTAGYYNGAATTTKKITGLDIAKTANALVTEAVMANGDYITFLDGSGTGETKKEAIADVATLFAGAGMTATSSAINVIGTSGITANADNIALTDGLIADGSNITSVGTIASGTWEGTTIAVDQGGTGATSLTADGVLFGNGTSAISAVDLSTSGNIIVGGPTPAVVTGATLAGDGLAATVGDGTLVLAVETLNQDTTGTAAIATAVTVADESSDTTCFPLFVTAATGDLSPKSGSNLAFNSSTGILTAVGFEGALAGAALYVTNAEQEHIQILDNLTTLTVDDINLDGKKITMVGSAGATFTAQVATNGVTILATTDAIGGSTLADLTLDIDGEIKLESANGIIEFYGSSGILGAFDDSGDLTVQGDIFINGVMRSKGTGGLIMGSSGNTDAVAMSMIVNTGTNAGKNLTVSAGSTTTGGNNLNGGDLILASGAGDGTGTSSIQFQTKVSGTDAVAERMRIDSSGNLLVLGKIISAFPSLECTAAGIKSIALGNSCTASGDYSVAIGLASTASGEKSAAFGISGIASGTNSLCLSTTAFGAGATSVASGIGSIVIGTECTASANYSFAAVEDATASAINAVAIGRDTTASGVSSVALGKDTTASGYNAFCHGRGMTVSGDYSFGIALESNSDTVSQDNTMVVMGGKLGIGVVDPDMTLEVLSTSSQQKWSYDADSFLSMTVADSSHTTIATGESGNIILDAGGAINLDPAAGSAILLDGTISVDAGVVTGATSITSTAFVGALTGNASGTAATVTAADQPAITSLGDLTTLTVDDVLIEGKIITMTGSAGDTFKITVAADGATTVASNDSGGVSAHLKFLIDGHVEFDNCAVGFDRHEETWSVTDIKSTGGTDDTDIDFRESNKIRLEMTGDIAQMNLVFPAVSGNFLMVCNTDGDHDVTAWKVWKSNTLAATVTDVMWSGGSVPAFTDTGNDIVSFYWDADEETAYGVASLAFATP